MEEITVHYMVFISEVMLLLLLLQKKMWLNNHIFWADVWVSYAIFYDGVYNPPVKHYNLPWVWMTI